MRSLRDVCLRTRDSRIWEQWLLSLVGGRLPLRSLISLALSGCGCSEAQQAFLELEKKELWSPLAGCCKTNLSLSLFAAVHCRCC